MPVMQDNLLVTPNSVSANVLAGQLYEFVPSGTRVTLACCGSGIGLRATLIANIPVMNDQAINSQNRFPVIPDDIIFQGMVRAARLVLTARNTTGANLTFYWRVDVN